MIRALWTSASSLAAGQLAIDAISNNVANVNTTGYKKGVTQFQDLFYQRANTLGNFVSQNLDTGISIGTGTKTAALQKVFEQGKLEQTGSMLDLAIDGEGFFKVMLSDGTAGYTRDGSFVIDANGELMTSQGYRLSPALKIPRGAKELHVGQTGIVTSLDAETGEKKEIGSIGLFKVENPNGMLALGENIFIPSESSGSITQGAPGSDGLGALYQGLLEGSNIELADEMTQLVIAQRAYQVNSRALRTADEMIQIATAIRA